jgi:hypothetical protein
MPHGCFYDFIALMSGVPVVTTFFLADPRQSTEPEPEYLSDTWIQRLEKEANKQVWQFNNAEAISFSFNFHFPNSVNGHEYIGYRLPHRM